MGHAATKPDKVNIMNITW